jgi:hypothetical protein
MKMVANLLLRLRAGACVGAALAIVACAGDGVPAMTPTTAATAATTCILGELEDPSAIGNGFCDAEGGYNSHACGWDGGDCCLETCTSTPAHECGYGADGADFVDFPFCHSPRANDGVDDHDTPTVPTTAAATATASRTTQQGESQLTPSSFDPATTTPSGDSQSNRGSSNSSTSTSTSTSRISSSHLSDVTGPPHVTTPPPPEGTEQHHHQQPNSTSPPASDCATE